MTVSQDIAIFFTGGTIAMRPLPGERGVVPGGDFDRLIKEVRTRVRKVRLRLINWGDRPSPHMTPELMFQLAQEVEEVLAEEHVLGAVILHGTDVLVESAFMADITVKSTKPVIFTGSMLYYKELGYDGLRNLAGGIKACLMPLPPEIGVVLLMTDRLFRAREVIKINSLNIDAFESPGSGPVGYLAGDSIILTRHPSSRTAPFKTKKIEPNVALITCYTGMTGELIESFQDRGISGLVIEAFGAGNVPPTILPALETLMANNVPVVLTTRCLEGGVWPIYAYPGGAVDLEKRGAILAGRLSGPKARLQLMAALGLTSDINEIKEIFHRDRI